MAIEVEPRSSDYLNKPTPPVSPPPHRDYQHNNNQMIPTTTTKDQAIAILPGISKSDTSDQDFNWMFAPIEDTPGFTTSDQDDFHTIPTITTQDRAFDSKTSNQDDFDQMTLEDQMYDEECYNYFIDNFDDDDEKIAIDFDMFGSDPTTDTTPTAISIITAKDRPDPPDFSVSKQDDVNKNKNKNKQATPPTTRPTTKSQPTTTQKQASPPKTKSIPTTKPCRKRSTR